MLVDFTTYTTYDGIVRMGEQAIEVSMLNIHMQIRKDISNISQEKEIITNKLSVNVGYEVVVIEMG